MALRKSYPFAPAAAPKSHFCRSVRPHEVIRIAVSKKRLVTLLDIIFLNARFFYNKIFKKRLQAICSPSGTPALLQLKATPTCSYAVSLFKSGSNANSDAIMFFNHRACMDSTRVLYTAHCFRYDSETGVCVKRVILYNITVLKICLKETAA